MVRVRSIATTVFLWTYFLGGFLAGGWILFSVAGFLRGRRGLGWSLGAYLRSFILVVRVVIPGLRIRLPQDRELQNLRGTVVVCNHLSFLDPLLLLAFIPNMISIVRPDFFRVPIFGWLLRGAGFLGPDLFVQGQPWIDRVASHLQRGGNLLIFPEGTRSRNGRLSPFKKGAFFLAKHLGAPILVLRVDGTDRVFAPGSFTFDASPGHCIDLRPLALVTAEQAAKSTTGELTTHVRTMIETAVPLS